jgi:hypothetical protein
VINGSTSLSESVLGIMSQILPLPEINFAELTTDQLWSIFETKAFFGGALAYAVFSRASKLGCPCSVTLAKTREGRKNQSDEWRTWSSRYCNLLWAKKIAFDAASLRPNFRKRLNAIWSAPVPSPYQCCSEVQLPNNIVARVSSLAVDSGSADWLEQVLLCENDARRCVVPFLWLKLKEDFVFNRLWTPSYRSSFSNAVDSIDPSASHDADVPWFLLADCWSRIFSNMCRFFSSPVVGNRCDPQLIWNHCVLNPAYAIPISEHSVMMWIWLLWSSSSLPTVLMQALRHNKVAPDGPHSIEERLKHLQYLRSKGIVTNDEFTKKRQRIIDSF